MNRPLSSYDLKYSQGQAVIGLLERAEVPPLPSFYRLFYDYVAGVKGLFASRLDTLLAGDADNEQPVSASLYAEFIGPYEKPDEPLERAVTRIAERLSVLDRLVQESLSANALEARSLASCRVDLEESPPSHDLMIDLVARLKIANDKARQANVRLKDELAVAQDELAETREELKRSGESSRRDPLTGVINLAGIDMMLSQLLADAAEGGRGFAVALVDIDHFKSLNDNYGHQTGDEVLKTAVRLLNATARGPDVVGRIGGDEFIVILPDTDLASGVEIGERFCKAVREHDLSYLLGRDVLGGMTVSIGLAVYRAGDNINSLFERADRSLYEAKGNGRNRVSAGEGA